MVAQEQGHFRQVALEFAQGPAQAVQVLVFVRGLERQAHQAEKALLLHRREVGMIFDLVDASHAEVGGPHRVAQVVGQTHDGNEERPAGLFKYADRVLRQRHNLPPPVSHR